MARTELQIIYDEFDHLIDLCEQCKKANLKGRAKKLRNMRDNLPPDPEEENMVLV